MEAIVKQPFLPPSEQRKSSPFFGEIDLALGERLELYLRSIAPAILPLITR